MPSARELANAIRALSMDAVEQANSGHPGMPMGMADIAEVLWNEFLSHNPHNPQWPNRDRFILSNGHGCLLQYALLHLTGYPLSIEDLKNFRQLHSKTPGHPEYGITPGVEVTTGPLGQGLAMGVGMAIAERMLAAQFNRPGIEIVDHMTYVFAGDGCLMEGISHEVCSLAGTLSLGKLIVFYDDNKISIDGEVKDWFTDNTPERFKAYGWQVIPNVDGHDRDAIYQAIAEARRNLSQPTLICCRTTIAYGAPNAAGTCKAHGAPLGADEIAQTRTYLEWPHIPFAIPNEVYEAWDARAKGTEREQQWNQLFSRYQQQYPKLAYEFIRRLKGELPKNWQEAYHQLLEQSANDPEKIATRQASLKILNPIAEILPELIGGSADLTASNCTWNKNSKAITHEDFSGNYLYYGVREFGMSAIMNGLAAHGGFIPYGGTFLVFLDYARNAVRLSALMGLKVIYVLTHDSIGLGEDGPTHQPVEHLAILRNTPNISVWRPADNVETAVAWMEALSRKDGPSALCLSRQGLPHLERNSNTLKNIARGGYILKDSKNPEIIFIATGSEVSLALEAYEELAKIPIEARVVSMPSVDRFMAQDQTYRDQVLPPTLTRRVAIEAASSSDWYRFVGLEGRVIGLDRFGESAPAKDAFKALGFSIESIMKIVNAYLASKEMPNAHY